MYLFIVPTVRRYASMYCTYERVYRWTRAADVFVESMTLYFHVFFLCVFFSYYIVAKPNLYLHTKHSVEAYISLSLISF